MSGGFFPFFTPAMNLILFQKKSDYETLPGDDRRAVHIREVLGMQKGDRLDIGLVNGPRGKAVILNDASAEELRLKIEWGEDVPKPWPISLLAGLPRPQTARKLLRESASFGLVRIVFFETEKGEPSYKKSKLWSTGEWRRQLAQGAEQAFSTVIPQVSHFPTLRAALNDFAEGQTRIGLDNYESAAALSRYPMDGDEKHDCLLAVGPERGWSAGERDTLRESGFTLVHLGERVLRIETATIAAISIMAAKMGLM